ncbi:hypothetical protein MTO96_045761 [Rhipicephalus appendiculatus]
MKRRKRYLECSDGGSVADLPKTTKFRLVGSCSGKQLVASAQIQSAAVAPLPTPPLPRQEPDDAATPAESGNHDTEPDADQLLSDSDSAVSGGAIRTDQFSQSVDQSNSEEVSADAQKGVPPEDLLALSVNFATEFGLPWKGVEALQKLVAYVADRKDVPASKYLFKKCVSASVEAARFHFYCPECLTHLAETSGTLQERNSVQSCCSVCKKNYSGREMLRDGHFF